MNLLIYGVGSKMHIIQYFLKKMVYEYNYSVLIRGYHSGLMPKTILLHIEKFIKDVVLRKPNLHQKWGSTGQLVEFIKRVLNDKDLLKNREPPVDPLIIVIHSMDVGVLKGQEWQEMLGELSTCELIRFVVSVDNIKSGVLFTDQLLDQFNFACVQLDTFEGFVHELEWQPDTYSAKNDN